MLVLLSLWLLRLLGTLGLWRLVLLGLSWLLGLSELLTSLVELLLCLIDLSLPLLWDLGRLLDPFDPLLG